MFGLVPFGHEEKNLFNYLDHMQKNFFGDIWSEISQLQFRTDILDKEDKYILQAELPGFDKKDINIDVNENYLTIRAQQSQEINQKEGGFIRQERKYGSFVRSFNIPNINYNEISASYNNGILELQLPKITPTAKPLSHKIEIK